MNAVIVYASWFGHNRAIARALARALADHGVATTCVRASRFDAAAPGDVDLIVLGTYTHSAAACPRLREVCATLPARVLSRTPVALFGTQARMGVEQGAPSGVADLAARLAGRGCEPAVPPLVFGLAGRALFWPGPALSAEDLGRVREFAADLAEELVPAPLI